MARAGKTFYQAARLLPAAVRDDVVHLYAFCRTVDDTADNTAEPIAERRDALSRIADALETADADALHATGWQLGRSECRLRAAAILVRAALADLQQVQPASVDGVVDYAFGVAGSVGLLMANVLRARGEGHAAAVALGCAMQLSNICRDVAEDAAAGRIYLPASTVSTQGVYRALQSGEADAVRAVWTATQQLLARADTLYALAYTGMWTLPWRTRWSILAAAMCYREIGVAVGRDVQRSWQCRTVVGRGRKLQLIALAGLRLLLPRFWWPRPPAAWPGLLGGVARTEARRLGMAR